MRRSTTSSHTDPAPESLQEIKVLTANSPADYGNVNGGGAVSILKSGTNQFHGSAYGYVQDYRFNALIPGINIMRFRLSRSAPILNRSLEEPLAVRSSATSCSFSLITWERAITRAGTAQGSVFTQAMRNGDFSALLAGSNPSS